MYDGLLSTYDIFVYDGQLSLPFTTLILSDYFVFVAKVGLRGFVGGWVRTQQEDRHLALGPLSQIS